MGETLYDPPAASKRKAPSKARQTSKCAQPAKRKPKPKPINTFAIYQSYSAAAARSTTDAPMPDAPLPLAHLPSDGSVAAAHRTAPATHPSLFTIRDEGGDDSSGSGGGRGGGALALASLPAAIELPPGEEITPTCTPVPAVAFSAADPLLSLPRPLNHPIHPEAAAATHVDVSGVSLPGGGSPPRPVQAARRPKGGNWASLANQMTRAIKAEETVAAQHMRAASVKTIAPGLRLRILECKMEAYLINARCVVEGQSAEGSGERRGERVVLFLRKGTHKVIPEAGVRVLVYSPWYDMHHSFRFPSGLKRLGAH